MGKPRYILRIESAIVDPPTNPIYSILMDRERRHYNLLDEQQTNLVLEAASGRVGDCKVMNTEWPFKVYVELATIQNDLETIDLGPTREDVLSAPICAYFEISNQCNLSCLGCYQGERADATDSISTEEIFRFLDNFSRIGGFIVRLTGNEPTVHKDVVPIVAYGTSLGLKMALNTNGVVSKRKIHDLVNAGISEVVVSLDGRPEIHNYLRNANIFDRVVSSLQEFGRLGAETRINATISKTNLADVRFIATLAKDCETYVSYIPMRSIGWAVENLDCQVLDKEEMKALSQEVVALRKELGIRLLTYFDIYDEKPDYYHPMFQATPCHSRKNVFIDHTGNVFPCDHLVGLGDALCGGNVRDGDFLDIWLNGPGLERFRKLRLSEDCTERCEHCLRDCNGGCISELLRLTGGKSTTLPVDRLCPLQSAN